MKKTIILCAAFLLTSCAALNVSFWDDNEAYRAIDIRVQAERINCDQNNSLTNLQLQSLQYNIKWLKTYSESKRTRDVTEMIVPIEATIDDFVNRKSYSPAYCKIKRNVIMEQSKVMARAIMVRY
jgi:capsular polysaccharide biosynthesis protein